MNDQYGFSSTNDEYDLIEVDQTKKTEQYIEEVARFERAILEAQNSRSLAGEAIANELAALFYLESGKERNAAVYMQDAYQCYAQLDAQAKMEKLRERYSVLLKPIFDQEQEIKAKEDNYFTDEFIATISHEFRNPLNGILGMSEALLEEVFGGMNEQQLNAVTTIDRSGWYLLALINNMVDLSKIQVGNLELEIAHISVAELCNFSATLVRHHAIQKQIQLDTDVPVNSGCIAVDVQRMRQVLINLLNHAIESTPIGGKVKLVVTRLQTDGTYDSTDSNDCIQFSVIDTSKETAPAYKDQFLPSAPLPNTQRIGFGLMLVSPIVELHGGSLSFQSVIGQGSRIDISLPHSCLIPDFTLDQNGCSDDLGTRSGVLVTDRPNPPLILIVEDNELNINTISSYLTAKGYRPIIAQDGQAAIDMTQRYCPDLILMDIQMPGMDGLEAITHIRQTLGITTIPIIALTALAMEGDREKCLAAGANEYIPKPVKLRQLHKMIRQFLISGSEKMPVLIDV